MPTADRLPVTILTGFLGSGKTTLLRELLRHPDLTDTAVVMNEFGEVGLDHILLQPLDQEVILLPRGCLCCAVQGELDDTLRSLYRRRQAGDIPYFKRVIIETSGLADPAPIMQTLFDQGLLHLGYGLNRVIATLDSVTGMATLDRYEDSVKQLAVADIIVMTKRDIAEAIDARPLQARLAAINRHAPIHEGVRGQVTADLTSLGLDRAPCSGRSTAFRHSAHAGHNHPAQDHINSVSIVTDRPLSLPRFNSWLRDLTEQYGEDLLRTKGILAIAGEARPVVFHGVQHVFHPIEFLPEWPEGLRQTRLVMIVRDLDERQLLASFERHVLAFSA